MLHHMLGKDLALSAVWLQSCNSSRDLHWEDKRDRALEEVCSHTVSFPDGLLEQASFPDPLHYCT